jgi:hypothetical protein
MVAVRATAKTLHGKALSSMRTAMTAFNSPYDDGRPTVVLLHLQHAFEMLLKAALVQGGARVFDKKSGRSTATTLMPWDSTACPARQGGVGQPQVSARLGLPDQCLRSSSSGRGSARLAPSLPS